MVFIWICIGLFGLMDILGFISIIQEHRKNKKDYARGLDNGYELAKRQFQPLQERWDKLKEWALYMCYFELADKMEELEDGKENKSEKENNF